LTFSQRSHLVRLSNKSWHRNMGAFRDELEKLREGNLSQLKVVDRLAAVFSPSTYCDTNKDRVSLFKLECALLDDTAATLQRQNEHFDDLLQDLEEMAELDWKTRDIVGGNNGQEIPIFKYVAANLCLGTLLVAYIGSAHQDSTNARHWETIELLTFGLVFFCGGILVSGTWLALGPNTEGNVSARRYYFLKSKSE
jgi:hypothetical protein